MFKNYYIILFSFFIVACGSTESEKKLTVALGIEPISLIYQNLMLQHLLYYLTQEC